MNEKTNNMRFCQGRLAQQSILKELSKIGTIIDCSNFSNEDVANLLQKTFNRYKSND